MVCVRTGIKVIFTPDLSKLDVDASEAGEKETAVS